MDQKTKSNIIYASKILIPLIIVIGLFLTGISAGIITFEPPRVIGKGEITATVEIDFGDGTIYSNVITLDNSTVLDFLLEVEKKGDISIETTCWEQYDSYFVDSITYQEKKYESDLDHYWAYYVNDHSAIDGPNLVYISNNDLIKWKFEEF